MFQTVKTGVRSVSANIKERIGSMSLSVDGTIREAMQVIDRGVLGVALLVEPQTHRFVGLVTDGDIRRALLKGSSLDAPVAEVPRPQSRVGHIGMAPENLAALLVEPVRVVPMVNADGVVADLAVFDRRVRLPIAEPVVGERELLYVAECVMTGWISSGGKFVTRFEEMFTEFCAARYAIATSSGTAALHLALLALDIGEGDDVIVPALTFIATANAVRYTGARPIFVDSEPTTWNIDPELIETALTARTKAVIPVHLYGHPAEMESILEVAARHGLSVVEDAAEAHGATYKGRRVGNIGDVGCFSFYGNKIISTGEGGMVVTDRSDLAERMRQLRDHGMSPVRRYWHPVLGYNYRMTNLQAALGVAQMEKIEAILDAKRQIADAYNRSLSGIPGLTLPPAAPWAGNVYWLYSVLVSERVFGIGRDEMLTALQRQGIETRPLFPPVHTQPIYGTGQHLPVAERLACDGLSLPSAANLTHEDVSRVAASIKALSASRQRTAPR